MAEVDHAERGDDDAPHSNVATSLVAVMPDAQWKIDGVYPENSGVSATSGYAPAVVCNDFVFAAGQMAADSAVLDPLATQPPRRTWGSALPIRAQAESCGAISQFLMKPTAPMSRARVRASLGAVLLKAQVHVPPALGSSPVIVPRRMWAARFKDSPCALTVVPSKGFATIEGIIEINLVALKNGATRKKEVIPVDLPQMASYGPVIRAGELIFASGLLPIGALRTGRHGLAAGQGKPRLASAFPARRKRRRSTTAPRRSARRREFR